MKRSSIRADICAAAAIFLTFAFVALAAADPGDCGQPKSLGATSTAVDALETLRTAVGQSDCGGYELCQCDVDASGKVVAGDALRVLKAAVGQPVDFDCPCMFPTPTTSELFVMTKRQGSFATADFAGTWTLASLLSGPGSPLWSRGSISVASNGTFNGTATTSQGAGDDLSGKLALSSVGGISCVQNCAPTMLGSMDSGKSVAAVTDTMDDGSSELMVVLERGASYSTSNLAGTWWLAMLGSKPGAPVWGRGSLEIQSNGDYQGTLRDNYGWTSDVTGSFSLASNGALTCAETVQCKADFAGSLDSGKTVAAMTQTLGTGTTELLMLVKSALSYQQSDLAGTWFVSSLATGDAEPYWSRGVVTIGNDGTLSGTLTDIAGMERDAGGRMLLSHEGLVSTPERPDLRCALDAGKTVLVCVDSWR